MKRCQIDVRRNPKRLCKHEIKLPTSKGIFGTFPEEMCQHLLSGYMSLSALASLAMSSKSMCSYITDLAIDSQLVIRPINNWIATKSFAKIKVRFVEIGVLLRATTALSNTTQKLNIIEVFLYELEDTYHKICEEVSLRYAYDCIGLFLYKFISNWDDAALARTFELINRLSRLKERIDKVLVVPKHGTFKNFERDVRQFVQEVFLKKALTPDQRSLWLSLVMEMYPDQQPRLLYLLYGPLHSANGKCTGMIDWDMLTHCYGHTCPYSNLQELADIVALVFSSNRFRWTDHIKIEFFNKLTRTPEPWCLENYAKLMFMLGHNMSVKLLQAKLLSEKSAEFSHIAYHLAQVSAQNSADGCPDSMMWFVRVISDSIKILPSPSRRSHTIKELFKAWKDNVTALADELDEPMVDQEDIRDDIRVAVVNLASVSELLMDRMFNDKDSNCFVSNHPSQNEE